MALGSKIKDLLSPGRQGYECTKCVITFVGTERCPSCNETEPVEPTG